MRFLSLISVSLLTFVHDAMAQDAATPVGSAAVGAPPQPSALSAFMPLIMIFVIFYFFLIRPQQKKMREHAEMIGGLKKGDKVVTGGGIIGTVTKVEEGKLEVEISEGVRVMVLSGTVTELADKKPAAAHAPKKGKKAEA